MGKSANLSRIVDADGGIGYQAGRGGTVTQATSKSTTVTLNKLCGQITMNNAALGASGTTSFQVNNSLVAATDSIVVTLAGGVSSVWNYNVWAATPAAGSFLIVVRNISAGSLSEAVVINFAVIKAVSA